MLKNFHPVDDLNYAYTYDGEILHDLDGNPVYTSNSDPEVADVFYHTVKALEGEKVKHSTKLPPNHCSTFTIPGYGVWNAKNVDGKIMLYRLDGSGQYADENFTVYAPNGTEIGKIEPNFIPEKPPHVDLDENVNIAKAHRFNADWFRDIVKNHKEAYKEGKGCGWDYKQLDPRYAAFGNFNYGVTGAALGIPDPYLYREAGRAQNSAHTSHLEWGDPGETVSMMIPWSGTPPYGDDPADQVLIKLGIDYYNKHYK